MSFSSGSEVFRGTAKRYTTKPRLRRHRPLNSRFQRNIKLVSAVTRIRFKLQAPADPHSRSYRIRGAAFG